MSNPVTGVGACDACILERNRCQTGDCFCCEPGKPWTGGYWGTGMPS